MRLRYLLRVNGHDAPSRNWTVVCAPCERRLGKIVLSSDTNVPPIGERHFLWFAFRQARLQTGRASPATMRMSMGIRIPTRKCWFTRLLFTRCLDWYGTKQHTASASYDNPATSSSRLDFPLPRLPRLQIVISTTHAFSTYRLSPNSIPENAATAPSKVWTRGHENRPSYICGYDYECEPKAKFTARWDGRVPTRWIEDAG